MNNKIRYFSIPLERNSAYTAHFRDSDYAVIFSKGIPYGNTENILANHTDELNRVQPKNQHTINKKTFTMYLVVTEKCNLQCTYCDVLGLYHYGEHGHHMKQETAQRALEILRQRLEQDPDLYAQIVFFGGEPLLNWKLLQWICSTIKDGPFPERIEKMIVTNGTLLNENKAAFLKNHNVYIVVSLDGTMEVNDLVRKQKNGRGSFRLTAQGLKVLHQVMPGQFGISCTVGSHNAPTLTREISRLQEEFKPCSIGINIYHYQQDGNSSVDMSKEDMAHAMLEAFRTARKQGIAIYQYIGIIKGFVRRQRNLDYCPACIDKLLITPAGRVGRCETLMYNPDFTIDLAAMKGTQLPSRLDWTDYTPEKEPVCQNCFARWICPGTCAYDQWIKTGKLSGVDRRRCLFHKSFFMELMDILLKEALKDNPDKKIVIPEEKHFLKIPGAMPLDFPPHTIWIVSLSSVVS